jgi:hypothetical protein
LNQQNLTQFIKGLLLEMEKAYDSLKKAPIVSKPQSFSSRYIIGDSIDDYLRNHEGAFTVPYYGNSSGSYPLVQMGICAIKRNRKSRKINEDSPLGNYIRNNATASCQLSLLSLLETPQLSTPLLCIDHSGKKESDPWIQFYLYKGFQNYEDIGKKIFLSEFNQPVKIEAITNQIQNQFKLKPIRLEEQQNG